jgi:hypothetical protein
MPGARGRAVLPPWSWLWSAAGGGGSEALASLIGSFSIFPTQLLLGVKSNLPSDLLFFFFPRVQDMAIECPAGLCGLLVAKKLGTG